MPIERRFLEWSQPALPQFVAELLRRHREGAFPGGGREDRIGARGEPPGRGENLLEPSTDAGDDPRRGDVDLSSVIVVVPGGRAGRRLEELLAEATQGRFRPPRIVTPGALPELLYKPRRPFANDACQHFAWAEVLRNLPERSLQRVVAEPPDHGDMARWLSLGRMLSAVHSELAADGLDFSDVAELDVLADLAERDRWRTLAALQSAYLRQLDDLELWDLQTARRVAVQRQECRSPGAILVVGVVDMNLTLRRMLDQLEGPVTAYVHAPAELADGFDSHGCVAPASWEGREIDLSGVVVEMAEGPRGQVDAVAKALRRLGPSTRPDDIVLGAADAALAAPLQSRLADEGAATRWVGGWTVGASSPHLLLRAVAGVLRDDRTSSWSALFRSPDLGLWLRERRVPGRWLRELDEFIVERVPPRLADRAMRAELPQQARSALDAVLGLLAPLRGEARVLGDWTGALTDLLRTVYSGRTFDSDLAADQRTQQSLRALLDAIRGLQDIPEALAPSLSAAEALEFVLDAAAPVILPPPMEDAAVEILGWLELPLDDAPHVIVCGFNEGCVPSSLGGDLFLPNALRQRLGLDNSSLRYARDAYALSAVRASRASVRLILGRRTEDGDPLRPSRLLFACPPEEAARRVLRFYEPEAASGSTAAAPGPEPEATGADEASRESTAAPAVEAPVPVVEPSSPASGAAEPRLRIPRPRSNLNPVKRLSVTAFKQYLACPYRFYLSYIEGLESIDDRLQELDPMRFGSLVHEVMRGMADGPHRRATDAAVLRAELRRLLQLEATKVLGGDRSAVVELQLALAEARLDAIADWQAGWAAEGWEIRFHEQLLQAPLKLSQGRQVLVSGRIDRVDYNRNTGQWAILDYKTGDKGAGPQVTHRRQDDWIDLQLPLYRLLAKSLGVSGDVRLGYVVAPKSANVDALLADWTDKELEGAEAEAVRVAECILDGVFWPPSDNPSWDPGIESICQSTVVDGEAVE